MGSLRGCRMDTMTPFSQRGRKARLMTLDLSLFVICDFAVCPSPSCEVLKLQLRLQESPGGPLGPFGRLEEESAQSTFTELESTLGLWNQSLLLILLGKFPPSLLNPLCMGVRPCIRAGNRDRRTMNSLLLCVEEGITGPRELLEWLYLHPASVRLPTL